MPTLNFLADCPALLLECWDYTCEISHLMVYVIFLCIDVCFLLGINFQNSSLKNKICKLLLLVPLLNNNDFRKSLTSHFSPISEIEKQSDVF